MSENQKNHDENKKKEVEVTTGRRRSVGTIFNSTGFGVTSFLFFEDRKRYIRL